MYWCIWEAFGRECGYRTSTVHQERGKCACCIRMTSQWAWWRLRSPTSRLFTQPFIRARIKENIKDPRHWPLCGEFTGDRWIPRRGPVNSPHKWPVTRKLFPFDDVIMDLARTHCNIVTSSHIGWVHTTKGSLQITFVFERGHCKMRRSETYQSVNEVIPIILAQNNWD